MATFIITCLCVTKLYIVLILVIGICSAFVNISIGLLLKSLFNLDLYLLISDFLHDVQSHWYLCTLDSTLYVF